MADNIESLRTSIAALQAEAKALAGDAGKATERATIILALRFECLCLHLEYAKRADAMIAPRAADAAKRKVDEQKKVDDAGAVMPPSVRDKVNPVVQPKEVKP